MLPPRVLFLLLLRCGRFRGKDRVQFGNRIFFIHILAAPGCRCNGDPRRNVDQAHAGFYLIYILAALPVAVERLKLDFLIGTDAFHFRDHTDVDKPILPFVIWPERTLADPLDTPF